MAYRHVSAMLPEAIAALNCRSGGVYVDGTLGGGGHARAICERIGQSGRLIGIDQDLAAVEHARSLLASCQAEVHLFHGNFTQLPQFLNQLGVTAADGILLDLGMSQYQLESSGRGFTFQKDEPLDMRMDERGALRARDLVNQYSQDQLSDLFWRYGEERWSRRISKAIVEARRKTPLNSTAQLVAIIRKAVPPGGIKQKIHPATRVFMALRIAVNNELESLDEFLDLAIDLLAAGGRLCILSFHSLEDRMVKQRFKTWAKGCTCPPQAPQCTCADRSRVKLITKRVMRPSLQEAQDNPMARSTRLRVVEKLAQN